MLSSKGLLFETSKTYRYIDLNKHCQSAVLWTAVGCSQGLAVAAGACESSKEMVYKLVDLDVMTIESSTRDPEYCGAIRDVKMFNSGDRLIALVSGLNGIFRVLQVANRKLNMICTKNHHIDLKDGIYSATCNYRTGDLLIGGL